MRVTDLWNSKPAPTVSFELFPAKSDKAAVKLEKTIDTLAGLKPDFVSVTFGAGGSTREGSLQLVKNLKQEKKLQVIAYFAGYGLGPDDIVSVLDDYAGAGIENILVVRGDKPQDENFTPHPDSFRHASDMLAFIRKRYDFCLGVAGYPEGHVDSPDPAQDMRYLKLKVDQGADFLISNYFYDNVFFTDFLSRCRSNGIRIPILPGVMPIYSVKMMNMLAGLCGATITETIRKRIAAIDPEDADALAAFGVEYAMDQCTGLLKSNVAGIHIYTMDRSHAAENIVPELRRRYLI